MKTADVVRRAGRNLLQAKGRTILTSLAIAVGAFTIMLALAAGNGGRSYLDNMVGALGSMRNINVSAKQEQRQDDDTPKKASDSDPVQSTSFGYKELSVADREKIKKIDGVERLMPMLSLMTKSVQSGASEQYQADIQPQSDDSAIELEAGTLDENYEIAPGKIVIPKSYLKVFGFSSADAAIGKKITATFESAAGESVTRSYTVVAVEKKPTSPLAFYTNQFRISSQDGQEIANLQRPAGSPESYFGFMVRVKEGHNVDDVKNAINAAGEYNAQTFADMRSSVMQMVSIVQYGLMGFGALAIIASIFGIVNTQYISVLERTQQIGLMKALGARRRDISRLFRYEAAWIGFLGGLIGVVLAFIVTLFNPVIADALRLEEGTKLLQFDLLSSVILILGLMLVAIISGYLPSRKAAKLDPIEALRTE